MLPTNNIRRAKVKLNLIENTPGIFWLLEDIINVAREKGDDLEIKQLVQIAKTKYRDIIKECPGEYEQLSINIKV